MAKKVSELHAHKRCQLRGFLSLLGLGVIYFKRENVSMRQAGQCNKHLNVVVPPV